MHISAGDLKRYLDGELPEERRIQLDLHLQVCTRCRTALDTSRQRAARLEETLQSLELPETAVTLSPQAAFHNITNNKSELEKENIPMWKKLTRTSLRPVWTAGFVLLILGGLLFIPQVRAAAVDFLGLFRVQSIQVVQFNPANLSQKYDERMVSIEDLMEDQLKISEISDPITVSSLEEASQLAGFKALDPKGFLDSKKISVQSGGLAEFTLDVPLMQLILEELDSDLVLPKDINGEKITFEMLPSVTISMGNCLEGPLSPDESIRDYKCTTLAQVPSPIITAPPGLNVDEIGTAVLQLLGMSADEAAKFSQRVDWTSTLIVPIPTDVDYRDVTVQGVPGTLLIDEHTSYGDSVFTLLWVKEGIIYVLTGNGSQYTALTLAESIE
jgi:hypothetical protein